VQDRIPLLFSGRETYERIVRSVRGSSFSYFGRDSKGMMRKLPSRKAIVLAVLGALLVASSQNSWADANEDLWSSSKAGDVQGVLDALNKGADVNHRFDNYYGIRGLTVLMRAACSGHARVVELLLAHGADVLAQSAEGQTALEWAAFCGRGNAAEVISIMHGTPHGDVAPGFKDNGGFTPLMRAAAAGHASIVKLLLDLDPGWDITAKNNSGATAVDLVCTEWNNKSKSCPKQEILNVLTPAVAKENVREAELADHGHVGGIYTSQVDVCVQKLFMMCGPSDTPDISKGQKVEILQQDKWGDTFQVRVFNSDGSAGGIVNFPNGAFGCHDYNGACDLAPPA
jgi:ankyrin repeat protein